MASIVSKGRPSLHILLNKLTEEAQILKRITGGFPPSVDVNEIWKDIWLEETHHSTALEGNTLTPLELYRLVEQDRVTGNKEMRYYLEVQGYAQAAKWVYEQAVESAKNGYFAITGAHISEIHRQLMGLVWGAYPPVTGDQPRQIRRGLTPIIRGAALRLPPSGDVPNLLDSLLKEINAGPLTMHPVEWVTRVHAEFEKIHPFADGNGRTGRLFMSYMLILYGFPPAIIYKSQRSRYLRALERAQGKNPDYSMLMELVARAVRENLNKLLLPHISEKEDLLPLSALAEGTAYNSNYLRALVQKGKLKAIKEGSLWLSSKKWLDEYLSSRDIRGRNVKNKEMGKRDAGQGS